MAYLEPFSNNVKITKFTSNDTWTKDPSAQIIQVIGWHGVGGGCAGGRGELWVIEYLG